MMSRPIGRVLSLAAAGLVLSWALGACKPEAPKTAPPPAPVAKVAPKAAQNLDLAAVKGEVLEVALTPSPAEMQLSLQKAGIVDPLAALVKKRDVTTKVPNLDQVAVRTGVVIADLLLTVKSAPKEDTLKRLTRIREGMGALGAGPDIDRTLTELGNRVSNDAVKGDQLVRELDEISGAVIPEIEYQAGARVVPLIQAGSWLEGANLVSNAIRNSGKYAAADQLLLQPEVVTYFLKFVKDQGPQKAPDEVVKKLEATLTTLQSITQKSTLVEADVTAIQASTDSVLAML
jgi:hypothetical protein